MICGKLAKSYVLGMQLQRKLYQKAKTNTGLIKLHGGYPGL